MDTLILTATGEMGLATEPTMRLYFGQTSSALKLVYCLPGFLRGLG